MRLDVIAQLVRRVEDIERRHANSHREGKIKDVDHEKGKVIVTDGVWTSGWLDWNEHNSPGGIKTRTMPRKDAGVVVKAMNGNLETGTVTFGAYPTELSPMPEAKNGENVWQMGADDPKKGKQVKITTDDKGSRKTEATDSVSKTVGDYTHTMTKDGGHEFKAGDKVSFKMTKDGGHEFKAGDSFSFKIDPNGGHELKAGGQSIKLNGSGVLMDAITAFAKNYGLGAAPGAISQIDNATPGSGV